VGLTHPLRPCGVPYAAHPETRAEHYRQDRGDRRDAAEPPDRPARGLTGCGAVRFVPGSRSRRCERVCGVGRAVVDQVEDERTTRLRITCHTVERMPVGTV
jgi:hypothetical protein